jgi:hypothetical protein
MNQKSIATSLRFKSSISQLSLIIFIEDIVKQYFKLTFKELNYTITDKSTNSWKQTNRTIQLAKNGLKKYEDILKASNSKVTIDFELLLNLPDYQYKSIDIDMSVLYSKSDDLNSLNFIINYERHKSVNIREFLISTVVFLQNNECEMIYGFVTCIDNSKKPSFYIEGLGDAELSQEEMDSVQKWLVNKNNCDKKIWKIFWGNIISGGHVSHNPFLLENIADIVGEHNFKKINNNCYWFNLSSFLIEDDSRSIKEQEMLEELMNKNNLMMI